MNIAVLGSGRIGGTLGRIWAHAGHQVVFGVHKEGSKSIEDLRTQGLPNTRFLPFPAATEEAEVVLLATPFPVVREVLEACGGCAGKLLIDATNALPAPPAGFTTGTEAIASWAPSATLVKAFNSTGHDNVANPNYGGISIDTYICGDDPAAKEKVQALAGEAGFTCIDVGDLRQAQLLESLAKLWIQLAYGQNRGTQIAFKLLSR